MEKLRTVSVKELVEMFVAISYLQEQRIINYNDIYEFIDSNKKYSLVEFKDLIDEVRDTLDNLVSNETLSKLYPNTGYRLYRVNDKINFLEISKYPEDYLKDMNKVFFNIIKAPDNLISLSLTVSNLKQKNNR